MSRLILAPHLIQLAGISGHQLIRCAERECRERRHGGRCFLGEMVWRMDTHKVVVFTRECQFCKRRHLVVVSNDTGIAERLPDLFPGTGLFPRDLGLYASVELRRGTEKDR